MHVSNLPLFLAPIFGAIAFAAICVVWCVGVCLALLLLPVFGLRICLCDLTFVLCLLIVERSCVLVLVFCAVRARKRLLQHVV